MNMFYWLEVGVGVRISSSYEQLDHVQLLISEISRQATTNYRQFSV
jgi:hypothetical protein